jgi:hypothetical protein
MSYLLRLWATHSSRSRDSVSAAAEVPEDLPHEAHDLKPTIPNVKTGLSAEAVAKRRTPWVFQEQADGGSSSQLSEAEGQKYLLELWSESHPAPNAFQTC